jgi:leucyl-tRNA synthetase
MELYSTDTRTKFDDALGWLNKWACSRTYGLGTRLPFDEQFLIESLSDSTIYMAYYTVAHMLQGAVDGSKPGSLGIAAKQMTRPVWDYVFLGKPYPTNCGIPEEKLKKMRSEFEYW